ncbi:Uncharacterised protein [Prevotella nigrescens]|nr:Uncharacterised protein [Prevotella nigrescens]
MAVIPFLKYVVIDTTKIQLFKQITTDFANRMAEIGCN